MDENNAAALGLGIAAFNLQAAILTLMVVRGTIAREDAFNALKTAEIGVGKLSAFPDGARLMAEHALHGLAENFAPEPPGQ